MLEYFVGGTLSPIIMVSVENGELLEGPIFDFHDYGRKCTLPETNMTFSHLKMNGWNTRSFLLGVWKALFSGANC